MNDTVRLGSPGGIRIGLHWSAAFVAWLFAWGLATRILPAEAPGADPGAYWVAGVAAGLLFMGSLLAHELAHALVARRTGMRVEGITLWLLGGVARLDGEAATPRQELAIAGSGPLASALLGAGFGVAAMGLTGVAPTLVVEAAAWLARVNVVLAVFNLLPGAPLDGGRIVRAIAWRLGRDRLRASLLAARAGRWLGFGLVGLGAFELVLGADPGGIWTIVLGLFLSGSAAAEGSQELAREALGGVAVRTVMTPDPERAPGSLTVDVFAEAYLADGRHPAVLVSEPDGTILGVAGVAEVAALRPRDRREKRVREIAVTLTTLPVVAPEDDVLGAIMRLGPAGTPYLLVRDGDAIVGLVTPVNLARTMEARRLLVEPGAGGRRTRGHTSGEEPGR